MKRELASTANDPVSIVFRCLCGTEEPRRHHCPGAGLRGKRAGNWSRWYAETLQRRIERVRSLADRIHFRSRCIEVIPTALTTESGGLLIRPTLRTERTGERRTVPNVNHEQLLELLAAELLARCSPITTMPKLPVGKRYGFKLNRFDARCKRRRSELVSTHG